MPLILSQDDGEFFNDLALSDAPAVRMTGSRIRFTNSGTIASTATSAPAIVIEGNGGTIVNQASGILRAGRIESLAVMGSSGTIASRISVASKARSILVPATTYTNTRPRRRADSFLPRASARVTTVSC